MTLYQHQINLLNKNPSKCLLAHGTGTGKTITALELAKQNRTQALIICPKALKPMWLRKCAEYAPIKHTVLTKEEFKKNASKLDKYNAIIIDEAHHFSGMTSQLSKTLKVYITRYNPKYCWLLTATPYRSTPWNIYTLAGFLGKQMNYVEFKYKFFSDVRMGSQIVPVARAGMENEIARIVHEIGDVVALEDCVDVPEQTFETEYLELTTPQQTAIKKLEEPTFITRFTKTHCIENGLLNSDGYSEAESFECNKTERIIEIASENKKLAVVCRYNAQIDYYKTALEKKGYKVLVINGQVKDRDQVVQEAEASPECVVLIQAQCSEGYELPSIPVIVFASLSFSYLDYIQCCGRFLRINKLKKNHYIHLVIQKGYDEDIYNCIMSKKDFDIAIYEKRI